MKSLLRGSTSRFAYIKTLTHFGYHHSYGSLSLLMGLDDVDDQLDKSVYHLQHLTALVGDASRNQVTRLVANPRFANLRVLVIKSMHMIDYDRFGASVRASGLVDVEINLGCVSLEANNMRASFDRMLESLGGKQDLERFSMTSTYGGLKLTQFSRFLSLPTLHTLHYQVDSLAMDNTADHAAEMGRLLAANQSITRLSLARFTASGRATISAMRMAFASAILANGKINTLALSESPMLVSPDLFANLRRHTSIRKLVLIDSLTRFIHPEIGGRQLRTNPYYLPMMHAFIEIITEPGLLSLSFNNRGDHRSGDSLALDANKIAASEEEYRVAMAMLASAFGRISTIKILTINVHSTLYTAIFANLQQSDCVQSLKVELKGIESTDAFKDYRQASKSLYKFNNSAPSYC
eukprot:gene211-255_t